MDNPIVAGYFQKHYWLKEYGSGKHYDDEDFVEVKMLNMVRNELNHAENEVHLKNMKRIEADNRGR